MGLKMGKIDKNHIITKQGLDLVEFKRETRARQALDKTQGTDLRNKMVNCSTSSHSKVKGR